MSLWLTGANAVAGTLRVRATAEARRQAMTIMARGARQVASLWTSMLMPPPLPPRRKRKLR